MKTYIPISGVWTSIKSLSAPGQHISGHPENTSRSWSSTTNSHPGLCNLYLHAKCGAL
ncbi:hypothetical protein [Methanobacterium ferruginis]|uniref:hypothetical protein n=1 Tax=Methanobacterium ferruginis TaxID=710191 RepID=UPI002572B2F1|nr:hypothetical protein [Methanobacterium ferruginis]